MRIALLSDVHGNLTALRAVIEDARALGATDYWLLGDTFMPGPASTELLDLIESLPVTVCLRGNWDDCLVSCTRGEIKLADPTAVYINRLSQYVHQFIGDAGVAEIAAWPLATTVAVQSLQVLACHHLPDKNYGGDLLPTAAQGDFDRLFASSAADMAVFGHMHHQLLRYGSGGQLIVNPGAVGQPLLADRPVALRHDLRACYAMTSIDELGAAQIDFRHVTYDIAGELALARQMELPYFELYKEGLELGVTHHHDTELLRVLNG